MELPKFHQTFMPILEVLSDDKIIPAKELINLVTKNYYSYLPDELRRLKDRIYWGKAYLKQGKFVHYPTRGYAQITAKGQEIITHNQSITLELLKQDEDFLLHNVSRTQTKQNNNLTDHNDTVDEQTPLDKIEDGINQINVQVKIELLEQLRTVDAYKFEEIVLTLLGQMGYGDTETTRKSHDGGIDGIVKEDKLGLDKIYLQAKRYAEDNKVREKDIRNFIGAMSGDTHKGVFFTTSSFDDKAIAKANNAHHKIILIDGIKLVNLMHEYNVGVQTDSKIIIKKVDLAFFEE